MKIRLLQIIIIILILTSGRLIGQTFVDQNILKYGDTSPITLVNDQNVFFTNAINRSEKRKHVLLGIFNDNWASKSIKYNSNLVKYLCSFDSTNNWNLGIKLTQQFNYPIGHTSPALCVYRKNHDFYIGPEYTNLLEKSIGDSFDKYQQEYWGINIGYRYIFDSPWKKTNLFLQMDFSIYQLIYSEYQLGYIHATEQKKTVVENNIGFGVNYKLFNHVEIFGGIGFGSTNGFFLMLDHCIPHLFLGIEYKIMK